MPLFPRSNVTASQVCNPPLPALRYLHGMSGRIKQCTPLLVHLMQANQGELLFSLLETIRAIMPLKVPTEECKQENHPGFKTHGKGHTKSKNKVNHWPHKRTLVQQNIKKRKEMLLLYIFYFVNIYFFAFKAN